MVLLLTLISEMIFCSQMVIKHIYSWLWSLSIKKAKKEKKPIQNWANESDENFVTLYESVSKMFLNPLQTQMLSKKFWKQEEIYLQDFDYDSI